jgi:hypothetical protein
MELVFTPKTPDKMPWGEDTVLVVRVALYVDSADYDVAIARLADADTYILADSGTRYFDYVIISGLEVKRGAINTHLGYSENLLEILRNRKTTIKPLRDKGIKVLLGISGGSDGVSVGSLTAAEQPIFAQECADVRTYWELDGFEFFDTDGVSTQLPQTPYPALSAPYWNGEGIVTIPAVADGGELELTKAWEKGGGYLTNMLSYLIEAMGASSSFQGDIDPDAKEHTPILLREIGFGQYIPPAVPRYAFATSLDCISYFINTAPSFGVNDEGESHLAFVNPWSYAPVMFDLAALDRDSLIRFSERLGNGGDCEYGLIYYTNLPEDASGLLSITSIEVFGEEVVPEE